MSKKQLKQVILIIISAVIFMVILGLLMFFKPDKNIIEEVKDTTSPVITGVKDITIYNDEEIDLLKDIEVTDDVKVKETSIEGKYDLNTPGVYELTYKAVDTSNNVTKSSFKLTVLAKEEVINGMTYIKNIPIVNKTYGLSSSFVPDDLVQVGKAQMVRTAAEAFLELQEAAKTENINIFSMTGYRSISFQTSIYNGYLKDDPKEVVDTYSARPGYSEHHTGLAVDVNSLKSSWGDTEEGIWLNNNAYKYGFIIRYPKGKEDITGYMYEPWHIRYVGKDLAEELYNDGNWITLEEYLNITSTYQD